MSACVPEKILHYESITWMFEVNVSLGNQNQSNSDVSINYRELHQKVIPGDVIYRSILAKSLQSCPPPWALWTVAHQAPLSMGFSRQEYWSVLPCSPPGDLSNPGIEPMSLASTCTGRWVLYH